MMRKILIALAAAFLMGGGSAYAGCTGTYNFCGSYTASATYATGTVVTGTGGNGVPTITNDLATNFSLNLTSVGATTGWEEFITTSPSTNSRLSGIYTSSLAVNFTFSDPTGMNDTVNFVGTYEANYSNTSDYDDWSLASGPTDAAGVVCFTGSNGDEVDKSCQTLQATFSDGVILDISLNDAQDWNITPDVEFTVVSLGGPHNSSVPEPASLALLGSALAGLGLMRRRRKAT